MPSPASLLLWPRTEDPLTRGLMTKMSDSAHQQTSIIKESAPIDVGVWYRTYGEAVFRRCLRFTGDRARALDLVQEVFLRAHRFKDSYRGESRPLAWLFAIANRCYFDTLRKKQPILREELGAFLEGESTESCEASFTRHAVVQKLLERVDDDLRDLVVYRYYDELDLDEIASRLGVNERTVRRKLEDFLEGARKVYGRL